MPGKRTRIFESDDLALARALEDRHPTCGKILHLKERIPLVIDTNKVLGDIVWMARKRTKSDARTDLLEVADASVVAIYAPDPLRDEVERHLPTLAREHGLAEANLRSAWVDYQTRLTFVPVNRQQEALSVRDPDDLPFIQAADEVGAAGIVTRDRDIEAMGGRPISPNLIRKLRDYARAKAFEVKTPMVAAMTALLIFMMLAALIRLLIRGGRKAGWPIIIGIFAVVAVAFAVSDTLRRRTRSFFSRIWAGTKDLAKSLGKPVSEFAVRYGEEKRKATALLEEIDEELGDYSGRLKETSQQTIPDDSKKLSILSA